MENFPDAVPIIANNRLREQVFKSPRFQRGQQLTNVTMPRPDGTHIRAFQWSGTNLASGTNPENGSVAYVQKFGLARGEAVSVDRGRLPDGARRRTGT